MIWSTVRLALREIGRNAMRSVLTILGIVIGVGAVISMVTLGGGATTQITGEISSLGSNLVIVRPGTRPQHGGVQVRAEPFDRADVEAIQREVAGIEAVAPTSSAPVVAVYGNENWSTTATGTTNDYLAARDWPLVQGRSFTEGELRAGSLVCLLGATVREELFGLQDPIGASIRLGTAACRVVGVLEGRGESTFGMDQDDFILTPLRALHRRITGTDDVDLVFVSATSEAATPGVQADIERLLRQRRRIAAGEEDDFTVQDMAEIASIVESTTGILTTFLGAIAAISLLVGGIGIMNIMLVSVTERTREIGIRLAIGARGREVLLQFLVEAVMLSLFGGLVGIGLGLAVAAVAAPLLGVPFVFDPLIVVIAFVFSGAVGVIFGYVPARRAARLDPIDALRYE
jgi:putative ABC transport system permease protein